jgi:Ca2+-binding EF-hand superfamily protein
VEFVFNMFDEDHSNSIDFNEFKRWLQKNQVRMSLADRPAEVDCNTPELKPRANSSKSKAS